MYKDIFESIRNEAEKRNLRERTIQLYCSDVSYFLRWIGKNVSDLTLEDAESFLTAVLSRDGINAIRVFPTNVSLTSVPQHNL